MSLKKLIEHNKGFSLIEVIVALAVAAIALTVLVKSLSQYANSFIYLGERILAQSIAVGELSRKSLDKGYVMPEFVEIGGKRLELILNEEEYFFRDIQGIKEISITVFDEQGKQVLRLTTLSKS